MGGYWVLRSEFGVKKLIEMAFDIGRSRRASGKRICIYRKGSFNQPSPKAHRFLQ